MKRYMFGGDLRDLSRVDTDVIIVGCGAAGLYTALCLDPRLKCIILNKAGIKHSSSMYAQGGVAAVIEPNKENDDPEQHFRDTLVAGAGLCDEDAVRVLVNEGWSNVQHLIELSVPFDKRNGDLLLTREGGHNKNRILHCGGDATGLHLTRRLYEVANERENITILDDIFLHDILTNNGAVTGVIARDLHNTPCYIASSKVVVATGGIGRVYRNSTNPICATGDGIAAALRAGAELKDMEFVQFHPTAFIHPNSSGRYFLISEALRGEGAILRNRQWEPFMQNVHPLKDLAPRDIVTRAIISEMAKHNIPHVYLDITMKSRSFLKGRFPTIYAECMSYGIDIAKDWIPVMPVQHYFMGGIKTDIRGRTNIGGLYACGEAACTGVHGANRLASNSILECLVFGRRCAVDIEESGVFTPKESGFETPASLKTEEVDYDSYGSEMRALMTRKCSIIRNGKELAEARARIGGIAEHLDAIALDTNKGVETYNQSLVSLEVIDASIKRKKSVGAHFRSDDDSRKEGNNA